MYEEIDDLLPSKENRKKSKRAGLLEEIRTIEDTDITSSSSSFLPSSLLKEKKPKKKEEEKTEEPSEENIDNWLHTIELISSKPSKKHLKKSTDNLFEAVGLKKKKKKKDKKNAGGLVNYRKEFEPEMSLYHNLLVEQNKFTNSLQKNYDSIISLKSSNRGVTKQMTDLIENINQARSLSMQLVEKHANTKKLIAELNIKQQKEFGTALGDAENMTDFASNYMKQMITERQNLLNGTSYDADIGDYNEDEMADLISGNLGETNRDDEVDRYLKYENDNVEVYVVITDNDPENYEFIAKNDMGEVLDDYPLPSKTSLTINNSTNVATDSYGQKYKIIWT